MLKTNIDVEYIGKPTLTALSEGECDEFLRTLFAQILNCYKVNATGQHVANN